MLTDLVGTVTDSYSYDAFGNELSHTGSTPNEFLYRGEQFDSDLGLYYLRARWYNPATGRFMTRDPYQGSIYNPASLHRYNYARANPANFIDPSGRAASIDYVQLASDSLRVAFTVTFVADTVRCAYWGIASTVGIVGQHIGQHIDGLDTLWHSCEAHLTLSGFTQDLLVNWGFAYGFGALGPLAAEGIDWFLEDSAQGANLELIPRSQTPIAPRLPQDLSVNPTPPDPLPLNRPVGPSPTQNAQVQSDITQAQSEGANDFRVNQQQVDAAGNRVGTNRPDLQYTDANGNRNYVEYDTPDSTRGPDHAARIQSNDPTGTVVLKTVK